MRTVFVAPFRLCVSASLCSLALSCARPAPPPVPPAHPSVASADLKVDLSIDPDPPVAAENHLHVTLRDSSGAAVDGAQLALAFDMPAMGSMPEMKGEGDVHAEGSGQYDVTYTLPMSGDWQLTLNAQAAGHPPAKMRIKVAPPRRGFVIEGRRLEVAASAPGVDISPERQQLIGLTFTAIEERTLSIPVRATGEITVDERQIADVTLRYDAWVEKLLVAETGRAVTAGEPLLKLYSPDLLSAEEELLQAHRQPGGHDESALVRAARRRLQLWDLSDTELAAIEQRGRADGTLVLRAPGAGSVLEKNVVAGSHVSAGTVLYRLGQLGRVWLEADFHEADAPFVSVGEQATISIPSLPATPLRARVSFVAPMVDEKSRTLRARLELPNAHLSLRPGMFATVRLEVPVGRRLAAPDQALLMSGEHRYAFVERQPGHLEPVEVQVGALTGEYDEIVSGLAAGDRIVSSPAFLVSSEAQLRGVLPRWDAR
jgi:Cu(I)/Ag(I) efflux system membrane fusion protein